MTTVSMSQFLKEHKKHLKELIKILSADYEYVSVLGTDTQGKNYNVQRSNVSYNDSSWNERGFVIRVYNGINYSEISFNRIYPDNFDRLVKEIKNKIEDNFQKIKDSAININQYPVIIEEEMNDKYSGQVGIIPEKVTAKEKLERLSRIKDSAVKLSEYMVDFRVKYEEVHVSKIFVSNKKDLEQSYIWSQGYLVAIVRKKEDTRYYYDGFSGLKGVELIAEMENSYQDVVITAEKLLDAERVEPGEYEIICTPDIAGLIAHEAFGHGVEMDMFVKNRAKAVEYLGKEVTSELVTMHDGAAAAQHVSSYMFDDEGVPGQDTIIIDKGILKTGIADTLSAIMLKTAPTGNGKRESYERKAYARMTNTFFASGESDLEEMIASIKKGYLLDKAMSGMEDPKNWGIQCMAILGREIKDGELTGRIISPVIMTGYVPDLLKNISMVSNEIELGGTGACGKGYKEFVKVSSGGPYIKTKARLG